MLSYPKSVDNQSYKITDKKAPGSSEGFINFKTYYFANNLAPSQNA